MTSGLPFLIHAARANSAISAFRCSATTSSSLLLGRRRPLSTSPATSHPEDHHDHHHDEDPGAYCVELVKVHDFDSYLCGLLMPKESRSVE